MKMLIFDKSHPTEGGLPHVFVAIISEYVEGEEQSFLSWLIPNDLTEFHFWKIW